MIASIARGMSVEWLHEIASCPLCNLSADDSLTFNLHFLQTSVSDAWTCRGMKPGTVAGAAGVCEKVSLHQ